jgi:excisionase family DNA binding protein
MSGPRALPGDLRPFVSSFVGPKDAARRVGLARTRIFGALASGELPYRKDGRRTLIDVADLDAWIANRPLILREQDEPPTGPLLSSEQYAPVVEPAAEPAFEPDWGVVFTERYGLLQRGVDEAEARARSYDFTVAAYRAHHQCSLELAKTAVRGAIAAAAA